MSTLAILDLDTNREFDLHEEDRENLYIHCARKLAVDALILHQARLAFDKEA